ncbi:hypothetical protein PHAVU_009G160300 [Phaseolus vulgaris]|uniref:Secreted protein n=1 Tax=Phaseolus vulgaris TaxID=3885 RepID=V7AX05_PHAVU|nr:hypothetical protein PHAVU_009G160300g [Phaseolus vulgaris]ESW09835.1 hypothetical protein PHAVU_009G160300g [Phaseolus vulgaris]
MWQREGLCGREMWVSLSLLTLSSSLRTSRFSLSPSISVMSTVLTPCLAFSRTPPPPTANSTSPSSCTYWFTFDLGCWTTSLTRTLPSNSSVSTARCLLCGSPERII